MVILVRFLTWGVYGRSRIRVRIASTNFAEWGFCEIRLYGRRFAADLRDRTISVER